MADAIEMFLEHHGPCLTSKVSEHLVKVLRLSPTTARKRVSRASGEVKRLAYITFPRKARFVYLQNDFGSPLYWERLIEALLETNSAYGLAIAAIRQRGGLIPADHFPIACGAPLKQLKHLSPGTIFERLDQAKLLSKVQVPGLGECITLMQAEGYFDGSTLDTRARLITEAILLAAIRDWVRNLGLGSYDRVATREGNAVPTVGTFAWDLTAPSYLGPMLKYDKAGNAKPGFIACDVLLGPRMGEAGMRPFINKCMTLRRLRNVGPCMQIFVANSYDGKAFELAKRHGIVPATPSNLFGQEVAEGLNELASVLRNTAGSVPNADAFDSLFRKLGKIEGASIQLRGTLFEYLAADIARKTISHDVRMNRLFKTPEGLEAEADVIAVKGQSSIHFVECKGYSPYALIPDKYMTRWLTHNVPVFFKETKRHPDWRNLEVKFEFWATGQLSDEALDEFFAAKAAIKASRYTIELRQSPAILELCEGTRDQDLIGIFRKHYMRTLGFGPAGTR
ncbi:hypothetical protein [Aminobacter niigataensis]|uniref:hypothetical protein n=1 Tax=Aminobacter niigataensis TaxID=83265 RepID=UPI00298F194E|nr:hypothetical protein [Aminobacter niigataensis]